MFPYKTNSADYLDYVAASLTREEILADPKFCSLLENPYIKDNMEVALAWHAAKFGDYQDKYNFVEYYLCNGPELDADTLLHYRALAQADPVVMEIAYSYFTDTTVLSDIREKKYGKKKNNDWTDCFKNPCFYLGDFSGVMGSMGDSKNVDTYFNILANKWNAFFTPEKKQEAQKASNEQVGIKDNKSSNSSSSISSSVTSAATNAVKSAIGGDEVITPDQSSDSINADEGRSGNSPGSSHLWSKLRPAYDSGWRRLGRGIFESGVEFADWCSQKSKSNCVCKWGDWFSQMCSHSVDMIDKANTARMLGDCQRMWQQVRGLRIFGSDNQYGPITSDQLVETRMADGTTRMSFKNTHPLPSDASKAIHPSILERAMKALDKGTQQAAANSASQSKTN